MSAKHTQIGVGCKKTPTKENKKTQVTIVVLSRIEKMKSQVKN